MDATSSQATAERLECGEITTRKNVRSTRKSRMKKRRRRKECPGQNLKHSLMNPRALGARYGNTRGVLYYIATYVRITWRGDTKSSRMIGDWLQAVLLVTRVIVSPMCNIANRPRKTELVTMVSCLVTLRIECVKLVMWRCARP